MRNNECTDNAQRCLMATEAPESKKGEIISFWSFGDREQKENQQSDKTQNPNVETVLGLSLYLGIHLQFGPGTYL